MPRRDVAMPSIAEKAAVRHKNCIERRHAGRWRMPCWVLDAAGQEERGRQDLNSSVWQGEGEGGRIPISYRRAPGTKLVDLGLDVTKIDQ